MNADFLTYHEALKTALENRFSIAVNVYSYQPDPEEIQTPALIVSLDTFSEDPDGQPGLDLTLDCEFSIYCIVENKSTNAELYVRDYAAEAMRVVRKENDFGFENVSRPESLFALAADFQPEVKKYCAWQVSWTQKIELEYLADVGDLVDFITYQADHSVSPISPVASDTVTLPQP